MEDNYDGYVYTLVKLSVSNLNDYIHSVYKGCFQLLDNLGNQYVPVSDSYDVGKLVSKDGYLDTIPELMPNGTVKTFIVFPKLENTLTPKYLAYNTYAYIDKSRAINGYIQINLIDNSVKTNASKKHLQKIIEREKEEEILREERDRKHQEKLKQIQLENQKSYEERIERNKIEQENREALKESKKKEKKYNKHKNKIDSLEVLIYSKFNNVLTYKELTKIENSIMNLIFEIKKLNVRDEKLLSKFLKLELKYYDSIPCESKDIVDVDENYSVANMTPSQFEIYTFERFKSKGYSPVLTSDFLDEGIDIMLTKDNLKYGVQCKYFKPNRFIGTSIMLHFLGSLVNIKADAGFLVTTGRISKSARFIAERNSIQIIELEI